MEDAGGGKSEKNAKKSEKFDTSFKKVVGGSLKLKGVEFKGKKAIVTKQKEAKNEAKNEYLAPGGVKKISNARVHGRAVGSMSYDPQANLNQRVKQKSDRFCMST